MHGGASSMHMQQTPTACTHHGRADTVFLETKCAVRLCMHTAKCALTYQSLLYQSSLQTPLSRGFASFVSEQLFH